MRFNTLIDIFEHRVNLSASATALVARQYGQWQEYLWRQWWSDAECLAAGLIELGLGSQERVALLSKTRMEWVLCDMGVMMTGAVVVPIYSSYLPQHRTRLLALAQCKVLIVEDPAQLESMLALMDVSSLLAVVLLDTTVSLEDEETGLTVTLTMDDVLLANPAWRRVCLSLADLKARGRHYLVDHLDEVMARRRTLSADDLASIVYTSGTTDAPKGILLTHGHFVAQVDALKHVDVIRSDDANLLILPLAHVFARVVVYAAMHYGAKTIFAEHLSTMVRDAKETRPTLIAGVPHIFEKIARGMQTHMAQLQPLKAQLYASLYARAYRQLHVSSGRKTSSLEARLIEVVLHQRLKALFGGELRVLISGGAALDEDVARFFYSCGMGIVEGYGLTETTAALTINTSAEYRFGSVGRPLPNVDLTIGYDGEILARGTSVARSALAGEGTCDLRDQKNWFHTGDLGYFDADGYLWITGRKKSILVTSGGKNICPDGLQRRLAALPVIDHAFVSGDGRPYLVALLSLDREGLREWAKANGLAHLSVESLIAHDRLKAAVDAHVQAINEDTPSYENIRKYRLIPNQLTIDNGMLTPTLKVKRRVVEQVLGQQITQMYDASIRPALSI